MASIHIQMCSSQYLCSRRCDHPSTVHLNVNQLSSSNNSLRKTWISRRPLLLMSSMSTSTIHGHGHGHDPLRLPVPVLGKRNCSSYSRDHSNSGCDHAEEEPAANAEEKLDAPPPEELPVIYREGIKRQWKNLPFLFRHSRGHLGRLRQSLELLNKRQQALKCMEPKSNDFESLQSMEEDCKDMKNLSHALNHFAADLKRLDANLKELFEEFEQTRKL